MPVTLNEMLRLPVPAALTMLIQSDCDVATVVQPAWVVTLRLRGATTDVPPAGTEYADCVTEYVHCASIEVPANAQRMKMRIRIVFRITLLYLSRREYTH